MHVYIYTYRKKKTPTLSKIKQMGNANTTVQQVDEVVAPVVIGEGLYGVVYDNNDGTVSKKQKIKNPHKEPDTEIWRESRMFDWIDTNTDKKMMIFFCTETQTNNITRARLDTQTKIH